jgi:hypothetical protein
MNEKVPIEVKSLQDGTKGWGVYIDNELFGKAKHSFDCDFAANMLGRIIDNAVVDHHPELRKIL